MKKSTTFLALTLAALASGANAASPSYTQSYDATVIFGSSTRTDALGLSAFINGAGANQGAVSSLGVFNDVVSDTGHAKTVFSFAHAITAFGGTWDLTVNNDPTLGTGLRIDIGDDGTFDVDLSNASLAIPTTKSGFYGVKSDVAFTKFSVAYIDNFPQQETYSLSNLQFTAAVPEPETYAMMLAGLAALSVVARRRKSR